MVDTVNQCVRKTREILLAIMGNGNTTENDGQNARKPYDFPYKKCEPRHDNQQILSHVGMAMVSGYVNAFGNLHFQLGQFAINK